MRLVSNAMATFSAKYYRTLLANCSGANGKTPVALGHPRSVIREMANRPGFGNLSASTSR